MLPMLLERQLQWDVTKESSSDSAFAGADTWAPASTLSSGVKKLGEFGGDIFEMLPVFIERLRERKTVNGKGGS